MKKINSSATPPRKAVAGLFPGYFFDEGGELIELLFCIGALEEVEVGEVEDLSFFRVEFFGRL